MSKKARVLKKSEESSESEKEETSTSSAEIKTAISEVQKAFAEHKEATDRAIAEKDDSKETEAKIAKIDEALNAAQEKLSELEVKAKQPAKGDAEGEEAKSAEAEIITKAFDVYARKGDSALSADAREALEQKALSTVENPTGGYLLPSTLESSILELVRDVSPFRSLARAMGISSSDYKRPVQTENASGGWTSETSARPETAGPKLGEISIGTHELYANPSATQTLLDDSRIDIEAWLAEEVRATFAEMEGKAFINGDGVAQPRGILQYPLKGTPKWGEVGYVATGKASSFKNATKGDEYENFVDLVYALHPTFRSGARFLMNRKTVAAVRKIRDSDNNPIWQPNFQAGQPSVVMGYPVTEIEDMPDIGANSLSIAFGGLQQSVPNPGQVRH